MDPLVVVSISARALDVPMKKAFGIAGGAQEIAANALVKVTLSGGAVGYGEAAPLPAFNGETQRDALAAVAHAAPVVTGRSAGEWESLAERIADAAGSSASAACALETALLDAACRARGRSLLDFFGGAEHELETDVTITTGTVAEAEREARAFTAFRTLKIKVGGRADHDVDLDVARVLAVAAARPDARLLLDANGGLSVAAAVHLADALRSRGVTPALFEQPVAPGSFEALAEVRARTKLSIALDESATSPADVEAAHRAGAADAINIKLMKSGLARAAAIARAIRAAGMIPMIGGMVEARLAMGASACFAAGLGGFGYVDLDTPLFLAEDPFDGGYVYDGARVDLTPIDVGHGCVPRRPADG